MTRTRHTPAQIVALIRRADELLARGWRIAQVTEELGVSEATFHRWRSQYGGIKADEAQRLRELELENRQLRATVANQALDVLVLRGVLRTLRHPAALRADLVQTLRDGLGISQRRACELLGEPRTSIRRVADATPAGLGPGPPPDRPVGTFPDAIPAHARAIPLASEGALG